MRLLLQVSFSSVVVKYLNHIKFLIWIISCTSPYCIILYDPEPFKYCFAEEDTKELAIMTIRVERSNIESCLLVDESSVFYHKVLYIMTFGILRTCK